MIWSIYALHTDILTVAKPWYRAKQGLPLKNGFNHLQEVLVWSYNANNTLNLHKWSSSNILASMDSFWCLLSKSAGTPATTLGHFFLFRMPDLDLFKIQNLINSDEIIQIGIVLPPVVITNITFTLKFAHDLIRSS